jgi:drug/metabolite transporter (DMT)-like permease
VRRSTGIVLVAIAASLWGLDAWIRVPLTKSTQVATIVFGEHVVLVLATLPFLVTAVPVVLRLGWRYILAAAVIGVGASAIATILFTQAFVSGDPVTPVVLQKIQPIIAVIGARYILGERPRPRFALFLVPALVGAWLIGVSDPFHPTIHGLKPMLFALGAATLWAMGTVLGRYLAREMEFQHIMALRFGFGLPAAAIALLILGAPAFASSHDTFWIAVLAVVTGLIALSLYYYGLKSTPAIQAALAELAFPVTAILVGYFRFGQTLTGWQWVGVGITSLVVVLLPVRSRGTVDLVPAPVPA